jgi:hypothetical protein
MGTIYQPDSMSSLDKIEDLIAIAKTYKDYNSSFVPPSLLDPHYVSPDRGRVIVIVSIVAMVLALVLVAMRIVVRTTWRGMNMGLDDWMIIPATLFTVAYTGIVIYAVKYGGLGRHAWDLSYGQLAISMKVRTITL